MSEFIGTVYETLSATRLRFSTKPGGSVSSGQLIEIKVIITRSILEG